MQVRFVARRARLAHLQVGFACYETFRHAEQIQTPETQNWQFAVKGLQCLSLPYFEL
jgi:hypothetical protein